MCNMTFLFFVASTVLLMVTLHLPGTGCVINPGLKLRIAQPGLDYAANIAVDILEQKVLHVRIPDQKGRGKVPVGDVDYEVTNINVTYFRKPRSSTVTVNPGSGATWSLSDGSVSVDGTWRYSYGWGWVKVSDHGDFSADAVGVSITVSANIGIDQSGRPTVASTDCSSQVNDLTVRFRGGASWLYNLFTKYVKSPLRESLQRLVCEKARKAIDENGNEELATLNVEAMVEDPLKLDYKLLDSPEFGDGFVESHHAGEFFSAVGNRVTPNYVLHPMPRQASNDRMLTVWVSDYLLNTGSAVIHKSGLLRNTLTKNDLPEDQQEYLETSCRGLVCLSTLLPQIGRRFPNASVEIAFDAVEPPMLSITTSNIQAHGNATANITARLNNGSQVYLFRVRISAASNISVHVDDDRLKGKVESFVPVVTIIDSQIQGISEMALQFAINILSKAELARVNKEGEKGIPLPKLDQFTLTRSSIQLDEHCLTIISDVRYSPKKK